MHLGKQIRIYLYISRFGAFYGSYILFACIINTCWFIRIVMINSFTDYPGKLIFDCSVSNFLHRPVERSMREAYICVVNDKYTQFEMATYQLFIMNSNGFLPIKICR